jgi:CHAD domain-containing protein
MFTTPGVPCCKIALPVSVAELEYLPPSEFDLTAVAERLPAPLRLDGAESHSGERAFYDTFDRRLRAKDLRLVHEGGFLRLYGSGRELATLPWSSAEETIRSEQFEDGPLRDAVAPLCEVRVLLRTARVRSDRRVTSVLDDEGKTVARLVTEEAVVIDGSSGGNSLRPRLRLLGVRGYDKELGRVRGVLEEQLDLAAAPEPLEDEAIVRGGGAAAGMAPDGDVELTPDMPADRAAQALSLRLLGVIEANVPGTLADLDTEFLHDLRVSVRRTRALQRELKRVFPPDELKRFRAEFKWIQQVTGPSRDLDVYLLEFDEFAATVPETLRPDLDPLRELLTERRAAERRAMEAALRSNRFRKTLDGWAVFLERLPAEPVDDRPHGVMPISEVAARRIDRVYRQMVKMGKAIDDDSPHSALHDLRKKGKELRYLLEFFSPLFPKQVTKPMVRTLKSLQDTLGRFQDREVQVEMIREAASDIGGRAGGSEALMALGVLVERLEEQQDAARGEFHDRFAAFSSSEQRALVKKTFE